MNATLILFVLAAIFAPILASGAEFFVGNTGTVYFTDIRERFRYHWKEPLVHGTSAEAESEGALVIASVDASHFVLNQPKSEPVVSLVLGRELDEFVKGSLSPEDICYDILRLRVDPRLVMASNTLANLTKEHMALWVKEDGDADKLKGLCKPVVMKKTNADTVTLICRCLDYTGKVAEWTIIINASTAKIESMKEVTLSPAGTFNYPLV